MAMMASQRFDLPFPPYEGGEQISERHDSGREVGLGTLVRRDHSDLSPLRTQYGIEVESPWPWRYGLRPVAYADMQTHHYTRDQQNRWITNVSVRAGFRFENVRVLDRRVQLLAEYYTGRSPNWQFFLQRVETVGLGLHVYSKGLNGRRERTDCCLSRRQASSDGGSNEYFCRRECRTLRVFG
jgi:hypothetical protein